MRTDNSPYRLDEDRLPFHLKPFLRIAWVSETAKSIWSPRLKALLRFAFELEIATVANGLRICGLLTVRNEWQNAMINTWADRGLHLKKTNNQEVLFAGSGDALASLAQALDSGMPTNIGAALSYPECCIRAYTDTHVSRDLRDGTFVTATATTAATEGQSPRMLTLMGPYDLSTMWRTLGIYLIPHIPCRFDCQRSVEQVSQVLALAESLAVGETAEWLRELLAWPVEWSSLHGIAEVKTPILKFASASDALGHKHIIRLMGNFYPVEGAKGVHFPYAEGLRKRVGDTAAFERGLAQARGTLVQLLTTTNL